jgi:16S rRNA (guanine527-N7)-methyltransferase
VAGQLRAVLAEARRLGFLGPGPVDTVVEHAEGFLPPLASARRVLDLGSGAGVPGLVIAAAREDVKVTLVDAAERRTDWLRRAVSRLGWTDRVRVITARAEELAHEPEWRASQDAVVARSFAPPLVTAECAAAFLRLGGVLVVSEPPDGDGGRWPAEALGELGLRRSSRGAAAFAVLEKVAPCPDEVPRRRVVRRR